jgi:hypothetical protein
MRLVSSQLAVPKVVPMDVTSFEAIHSGKAIEHFAMVRRAAIAIGRRARFAIVPANWPASVEVATPYAAEDAKRGFVRRWKATSFDAGTIK